jgi:heme exporter protein A
MRLTVDRVTCIRGGRRLFDGLSFALGPGEAIQVTGPNGAGKSSLLRLIAGLLRPVDGSVALEGRADDRPMGEALHFVGHLDGVKGALTVFENLEFMRALLGGAMNTPDALARLGLAQLADLPAINLSAGQRRRLALARLLVASRPLWLLDEPTTALDADARRMFSEVVSEHLSGSGMLVVATHEPLALSGAREINLGGGAAS